MMKKSLIATLVITLTISIVTPPALLFMPQRAEASWPTIPSDFLSNISNAITDALHLIEGTINAVANVASEIANYAQWINTYVLQPLAFIMSIKSLKSLTSGVISFVIGNSNGTGSAQFVQNLQGNLQKVGDTQMTAFLAQFRSQSNSPFASSIVSSLQSNYLKNTSLAGFWAASKCTLTSASPNINSFLAGNWSKGGASAWLSLTTQTQNNPFTLYQTAQSKLGSVVASAQDTRKQVLSFGQGFMSWCGTSDSATQTANASVTAAQNLAALAPSPVECTAATSANVDAMGNCYATAADASQADSTNNAAESVANVGAGRTMGGGIGVNPGDPCTNKDGTPGTIQTPGSTIKATLDKVLGSSQDKLTTIGNIGTQIGSIMQSVATIINTVNFAQQVLGGSGGGGLAAIGSSSGTNSQSALQQYNNSSFLGSGATVQGVYQNVSTSAVVQNAGIGTRVDKYESLWSTLSSAANATKGSLTDLANYCTTNGNTAIASQAQTVSSSVVDPILARYETAKTDIQKARDAAASVATAQAGGSPDYAAQLQALSSQSPTEADVIRLEAETKSGSLGESKASPEGSLNVSGGSTIDQLALIALNAAQLKAVCRPDTGGGNSGGGN